MRHVHRVVVAIVVVLLVGTAAAAPKWLRLESKSFVLVGATRESTLRDIASHLEQFRDVFGRALPGNRGLAALPTVVVVFPDERAYKPFWPVRGDKPTQTAGLFMRGPDANYVSLNAEFGAQIYRIVYHEYSHFITGNLLATPPLWLNEGLAEYNSTFEATRSGDRADVGRVIEEHVWLLRQSTLLPVSQLMAVDERSPSYNEWNRQTIFYAQSWALVHYLALGAEARRGQLGAFINRLAAGVPQAQAFAESFGCAPEQLDRELQAYLNQRSFRRVVVRLKEPVALERVGTVSPMSDTVADAYLGDLLARMGRTAEARTRLEAIIKADAAVALSHAALGHVDLREGHAEEAVLRFRRAVALEKDEASYQYGLGAAIVRSAAANGAPDSPDLIEARSALTRAIELHPDFADAIAHLGQVALAQDRFDEAKTLIDRARLLVPSRLDYLFLLAQAHAQSGNTAAATVILTRLAQAGPTDQFRDAARAQLEWVAGIERQAKAAAAANAAPGRTADPVRPGAATAPAANELNYRGTEAYDAGRYEQAVELLTRATAADPKNLWAWNNLGRALERLGRVDEAIAAYERQIAVTPRDEYAHGNLASALWRAGKFEAAEREFVAHLEIKPDDEWAVSQLAGLQTNRKRPADALATLEKAAMRPGARPTVSLRVATLALTLGAVQKAERALADAVSRAPVPADFADAAAVGSMSPALRERAGLNAATAVSAATARLNDLKLTDAAEAYRPLVYALAVGWTSMGRLALTQKDHAVAEAHLRAAWGLLPHPSTAVVMADLQRAKGAQASALEWYALAVAFDPHTSVATTPLRDLVADPKQGDALLARARAKLAAVAEVPFAAPAPGAPGRMEVMVAIDARGRIDAFHVLQADPALAVAAAKLAGLLVHEPVAGHEVPRLVRKARVTCAADAACRVALQPVVAPGDTLMFVR